jgi:hypothetical protein
VAKAIDCVYSIAGSGPPVVMVEGLKHAILIEASDRVAAHVAKFLAANP